MFCLPHFLPGIKYLEDIVRMMRVTRQGSPTFEAALQSAKDVVAGIVRGLTRGGGEDDEEEEAANQPEEDLTLPPKFSSQLRELQEKKLLMSRAGSVRAQRRARALKMAEELRRREVRRPSILINLSNERLRLASWGTGS